MYCTTNYTFNSCKMFNKYFSLFILQMVYNIWNLRETAQVKDFP
jgi:hypothetical protein